MEAKMQHCGYCGREIGVYIRGYQYVPESCGEREYEREIVKMVQQAEYDREERAREDGFELYR
jgi:hypothetical protein